MRIHTLFHPEVFQGRMKSKSYFEGWYFKLAVADRVLAIISGISLGNDTQVRHAFIQVFSSTEQKSWYVTYPFDVFSASPKKLDITIAGNRFSTDSIRLDIDSEDLQLHGVVQQRNIHPYPTTLRAPGIMGWYAYVPFMECFHGVVSMTHSLSGAVEMNGRELDFFGRQWVYRKGLGDFVSQRMDMDAIQLFSIYRDRMYAFGRHDPLPGEVFHRILGVRPDRRKTHPLRNVYRSQDHST